MVEEERFPIEPETAFDREQIVLQRHPRSSAMGNVAALAGFR